MDWKSGLQAFLDANPDLPQGEDVPPAVSETSPQPLFSRLEVVVERKGHKGKTVTIIAGFTCDNETLSDIAARMKRDIATGGSARGSEILLQGEHRKAALDWINRNLK